MLTTSKPPLALFLHPFPSLVGCTGHGLLGSDGGLTWLPPSMGVSCSPRLPHPQELPSAGLSWQHPGSYLLFNESQLMNPNT